MADSDQAIRDIVAQLQGSPTDAQVAAATPPQQGPVGVMPAPEVTPTMTWGLPQSAPAAPAASGPMNIVPAGASAVPPGPPMILTPQQAAPSTVPGPGGYSAADRFNKWSLPTGSSGPLSVADAQKVIDSYESTGGHAFAPAAPGAPAVPKVNATSAGDDWTAPVPTMTPPAVSPVMGRIAGVQPQSVPTMGALMVRPVRR